MRVVLWASPGYRAASLLPDGAPPQHAAGPTLQAAVDAVAGKALDAEALAVIETLSDAAVERGLIVSLVGRPGPPWRAFVVRGQQTFEQTAPEPEQALTSALAAADQAPDSPATMRTVAPPRPRVVQGTL